MSEPSLKDQHAAVILTGLEMRAHLDQLRKVGRKGKPAPPEELGLKEIRLSELRAAAETIRRVMEGVN